MEPTRNAWIPVAAWCRRRGVRVILVPTTQSADLRAYYSKHTKNDRLDSAILARVPLLHPEGLNTEGSRIAIGLTLPRTGPLWVGGARELLHCCWLGWVYGVLLEVSR